MKGDPPTGPGQLTPCPDQRNDETVGLCQGDLMLCEACAEARFPTAAAASSTLNHGERSPVWVNSEILCFMSDKGHVLTFDQLVKICTDFYNEDEILSARQVIENAGVRMPKRQGANKMRSTVEDILKAVLNPAVSLPQFCSMKLSRLPPVDVSHCDVTAILKELQGLRSEVREIRHLQAEIHELRLKLSEIDDLKRERWQS